MTKKEIAVKLEKFIKAHKPDEFKTPRLATSSFWDIVNPINISNRLKPDFVNEQTLNTFDNKVSRWWQSGKSPMSEFDILSSMDTKYVTHNYVQINIGRNECSGATNSNVVEKMFDLSFKYNIVGVEHRPGIFRVWVRESEDHQTNISWEVVEKIAKCLEF